MKNFKLFILLLINSSLYAQAVVDPSKLDDAYLNSLPPQIRNDLLSRMNNNAVDQEPVYRIPDTEIDKIDQQKTGVFGESFFDTVQTTFMPINEPNLDGKYILDFGDILEIQLIGQRNSINEYSIKRDGSISIIDIGKINLSGLSLNNAIDLIKSKFTNAYIGTEVFVSLVNIRDIQVLVGGHSYKPGIYTLNANTNIVHAINMSGGIEANGSYRNIKHIRDGEVIDEVDLYELFIYGKNPQTKQLRSGDTIIIEPYDKIVTINSGVKRPGKYEMTDNETLENLVSFANGIASNTNLNDININRLAQGYVVKISPDYAQIDSYQLKDKDVVSMGLYKYKNIKISGAVENPGEYYLAQDSTLSDLIQIAGGYTENAYPFGGFLNNIRALEINNQAKEKLYNQFIDNLISDMSSLGSQPQEANTLIFDELKNSPVSGRIIAEFNIEAIMADPDLDTLLEQGDEITIPFKTQQVFVFGQVANSGAIRFKSGNTINDYIANSGGALEGASIDNIFVSHPNGLTERYASSFFKVSKDEIPVYPGSIIYIPRKSNITNPIEYASVVAPIISGLAMSLASLSVLNNQ